MGLKQRNYIINSESTLNLGADKNEKIEEKEIVEKTVRIERKPKVEGFRKNINENDDKKNIFNSRTNSLHLKISEILNSINNCSFNSSEPFEFCISKCFEALKLMSEFI